MTTTATYDSAAGTFTVVNGVWTNTYPIADLQRWIDFYRNQQDRYPMHAASYDGDVSALEALATTLRVAM